MSRYVLLRLLDTFFRRWWLFLLPVVVLGAAGVMSVAGTKNEYQSAGTLSVASETLIASLTQSNVNYGYRTPADVTSSSINQLMQTGEFIKTIASTAGLATSLDTGALTIDEIRGAISVSAAGDNLVHVSATFANPEVAYRLAQATIDAFKQSVIDNDVSDSQTALDFFSQRTVELQAAVDTAQQNLETYLSEHAAQLDGSYTTQDQLRIEQLRTELTNAQDKLTANQNSIDAANLQMAQSTASINQRLQVIDVPERPVAREPKLKKMAMSMAMFLVLGGLLSLGALVIAAALDRSVRFPSDVQQRLGVPLIGAVPRARR